MSAGVTRADVTPARPDGLCRVTIDLDGAWCYRALHGVNRAEDTAAAADCFDTDDDAILDEGLPRFLEICERVGICATLFVVGRDVGRPRFRDRLEQAVAAGHRLMSHSFSHRYDLAALPAGDIVVDLTRAAVLIAEVSGTAPVGFRAPGYTTSAALWQALVQTGHRWSSSVLPSPAYLGAKRAVATWARLHGRRSASQRGSVRAYSPWFERPPPPLVELPITTALGLPWLGTTVALLPDAAAAALTSLAVATTPPEALVFELHLADFADGRHLPAAQPDATVPLAAKCSRLERALRAIAATS
jgi:peptidoglycan/xylan/chitin deacetylase (PgdA/CDA1 family)